MVRACPKRRRRRFEIERTSVLKRRCVMEQRDLELIQKFGSGDSVLANLYQQHMELEKELDKLDNKSYLTVDEQMRRADIKKRKLVGKDRIESILKKYRKTI